MHKADYCTSTILERNQRHVTWWYHVTYYLRDVYHIGNALPAREGLAPFTQEVGEVDRRSIRKSSLRTGEECVEGGLQAHHGYSYQRRARRSAHKRRLSIGVDRRSVCLTTGKAAVAASRSFALESHEIDQAPNHGLGLRASIFGLPSGRILVPRIPREGDGEKLAPAIV